MRTSGQPDPDPAGARSGGPGSWQDLPHGVRPVSSAVEHGRRIPGSGLRRLLRATGKALGFVLKLGVVGWAALAIHYSNLPWAWLRTTLAIGFAAFAIWALWIARTKRARAAFAVVFLLVLAWWITIPPSHDRLWRDDVAVMPRAVIDGDRVHITGVRDFDYRSATDFTPRYETRDVLLSDLTGVDFYISYWMPGPVGHTFVSFIFENAPPLSVSIEIRPESHEGYAPIASMFKQFELIYVVGSERDVVRVRTNFRGEDVYLFRISASPQFARQLFRVYLERINELADRPEFYHLLSNSCTVNIVRYARSAAGGDGRPDIRHYLNGLFDSFLYDIGLIDTTLPLGELRRRSWINEKAHAADDAPDFSERIRESLPPD